MKARKRRRARVGTKKSKGKMKQSTFSIVTRIIIMLLCFYIVGYCTTIITGKNIKNEFMKYGRKIAAKVVTVMISGKSTIVEWVEENESKQKLVQKNSKTEMNVTTNGRKSVENIVRNQMVRTEMEKYLEETTVSEDEVEAMQKLVAEVKQENVSVLESTSYVEKKTTAEEKTAEETTARTQEVVALKTIVPKPKLTGTKYTVSNLKNFENTIKKFYTVTSATSIKQSDLNIEKAIEMNFKIEGDNDKPQILIYHTHSQEGFKNTGSNKNKTIVQVGDYLAKILREQFGYNVLHDTSTYDLVDGELDRNKAYEQSRVGVSRILKDNPTINLVLDLHRDGVSENVHLVTEVNGKKTANIMFFNGMSRLKDLGDIDYLYNPYLKENLALSLQMKLNAEAYYPGFTRKNYINAYQYNLDLCSKSMLIEMGAQTNSFEEVKNAAEPLAMLINITMGGEE